MSATSSDTVPSMATNVILPSEYTSVILCEPLVARE